jgi:hypothetical protein
VNAVAALLRDLDRTGVRLRLEGDRIAYRGVTAEQAAEVKKYRLDIIDLLELHGDALLPLFRDPARPLTDRERRLLDLNSEALRRRFRAVGSGQTDSTSAA